MKNNLFSLNDKIVVITGATGLMGRQHAHAVASHGGSPIILDLYRKNAEKFADELNKKYNVNANGYKVDITCEEQIEKNSKDILKHYNKIDALVNNAANNPKFGELFSRLENFSLENWNADLAVGLTGSFLCAKHYGKIISQNPDGGIIINISSDLGLIAPDQRLYAKKGLSPNEQSVKPVTYSVVKTGIIGLTRYLATYWPKKVRCNALCPGGIGENLTEKFVNKVSELIPMGRMATVEEYKGALIFLLSDASKYMNGAIVSIDGGRTVW